MEWCTTHDQVIINNWFQHHQRHLYIWKSPGDCVRNQIDYITINRRFRYSIHQVKDHGGDHVRIAATMKVRLRTMRKRKTVKKLKIDLLRTNNEYRIFFSTVNIRTHQIQRGCRLP